MLHINKIKDGNIFLFIIIILSGIVYAKNCGNGIVEEDEQCDDGNLEINDKCTNVCTLTFCGDSLIQEGNGMGIKEECDDGNLLDLDGCSSECKIEAENNDIIKNEINYALPIIISVILIAGLIGYIFRRKIRRFYILNVKLR
ncbi:MAG TPA: DUF4215 domain-containing protein [Bacteroidia bacterium]|nr:DUF4215 domain-containing protein [Bacteroidia bacterium]